MAGAGSRGGGWEFGEWNYADARENSFSFFSSLRVRSLDLVTPFGSRGNLFEFFRTDYDQRIFFLFSLVSK